MEVIAILLFSILSVLVSSQNVQIDGDGKPQKYYGSLKYVIKGVNSNEFVSKIFIVTKYDVIPLASFDQNDKKIFHGNFWNHYIAKVKQDVVHLTHIDYHLDSSKIRVEITNKQTKAKNNFDSAPINIEYTLVKKKNIQERKGFYIKGKPAEIINGIIVIPIDANGCFNGRACGVGFCEELEEQCTVQPIPKPSSTSMKEVTLSFGETTVMVSRNNITISGNLQKRFGSTVMVSIDDFKTSSQPISFGKAATIKSLSATEFSYNVKNGRDITNYALSYLDKELESPQKLCFCNIEKKECNKVDSDFTESCTLEKIKFKTKMNGILMISVIHSYTSRDGDALTYKEANGIAGMQQLQVRR